MNAVIGMTEVLLQKPLDPEHRELVRTVREGGDALLAVLNDVLDLSAIEAGRLVVERSPFDPRAVVSDVVGLMQPEARRAGLALTSIVEQGAPERVLGDARRIRQVLLNLVGNALKFTEHGEVEVKVSVSRATGKEMLRFDVKDTGAGIPRRDLERIFQPFTQIDASPTRRQGGAGLGLAISRELALRMRGSLQVDSEPGRGSIFTLEVPLEAALASNPPVPAPLPDVPPHTRILVAEDNEVNVRVLVHMLNQLGLQADVVHTGAEALVAAKRVRFDCILMDVHMPEMDGLEATRRIRAELEVKAPVIVAVTADALPEQRAAVRAAGVDEVLTKPILLEPLAGALSRALLRKTSVSGPSPKSGETA
jgi:CheY-like chemotaxis protein